MCIRDSFEFISKKIVSEQRDQLWTKAVRPDQQQAPNAAKTKIAYSNNKRVQEVDVSEAPKAKETGKAKKASGKKAPEAKGNAKTAVAAVAAGKLQPPAPPRATGLENMVIPSPNWPKHRTPPAPEFRGCHFCLIRDLPHDHDGQSCPVRAEQARRSNANPWYGKGGGKGKGGAQGKGTPY